MPREFWRVICAALLCATLAACVSSGGSKVSENKKESSQDAARVRVELGQRYMEQGKMELALENLQKALEYDPNYVDAHTVIAVLYERLGKAKDAGVHYARAAELAPKIRCRQQQLRPVPLRRRSICRGAEIFCAGHGRSVLQDARRAVYKCRQLSDGTRQWPAGTGGE